jgi:hypothetical protein
MKNLQKFGVQELNSKEIKETEGGILGLPWFGYGNLFSLSGEWKNDMDYMDASIAQAISGIEA